MKLNPHSKAVKEVSNFSPKVQQYIWDRLQELKTNPTSHESVGTLEVEDRVVFKYRMKENGRGGEKDHRAVFDIVEDKIRIFAVFHRDKGYQKHQIAKKF